VVDLLVVFLFSKPLLTLIARFNFFASGHPLSGFSDKSIGLKGASTHMKSTAASTVEA
jgi:preprotein translocase subunit SecD